MNVRPQMSATGWVLLEDVPKNARVLAVGMSHDSAHKLTAIINAHDQLVAALKAIADNGMDARQCMETARAALAAAGAA